METAEEVTSPDIGWREPVKRPSLPEVFQSVVVPKNATTWRRFLAFFGPGYLIAVGYMDPGNWATDLEGGSRFGYALLWVVLASSLVAMLLQTLCARLGLATGKDLAQACRAYYRPPVAIALWILCEIAIVACDLAEVIGSAVALNLLFRLPLLWGVVLTSLDVFAILGLSRFGFRKLEAVVITLVATVAGCFAVEVFLARPDWHAAAVGTFVPTLPGGGGLLIALGILGATVMPHNLYLHSSIVQTRAHDETPQGVREAIRFNTWDTLLSLGAAFFVNAAILVLAASVFHSRGQVVTELGDAHALLRPLLGSAAATVFAVALLASGQSSTITGTLAGQIVMEGFLHIRIAPWLRRIVTRGLAIIPAVAMIVLTGGKNTVGLLLLSQVVLSMQLSFAIFPLVMFTSDKKRMGEFVNPLWLTISAYVVCVAIAALNIKLLWDTATDPKQTGHWGVPAFFGVIAATALFAFWAVFVYKPKAAGA